jgi:hypothetical protein
MMIPVFMPVPAGPSPSLDGRIQKLEHDLSVACRLIEILLERLEERLGPDFAAPSLLQAGLPAERLAACQETVTQIDTLLRQGEQGKAAKLYRQETGVTWDQAYAMMEVWPGLSAERKLNLFASVLQRQCRTVDS